MCGIAAIFAYSADAPGVERDELIAIRDRMTARGPDGAGEWMSPDSRVGLAHRRLSIIDLSDAGAQPMWNSERTLCVTFNGEIYNYQALRSQLIAQGYVFRSGTDTEVLLHLYAEHAADMVHKLRGMYAFAIWDARNRSLFCARDPFGIKPIYYADDGRTIRVASQVKALLQSKHIDTSPEPAGQVGFFLWGHIPDPFTLYRGIKALPAGHTLTVSQHSTPNTQPKSFCSIPELLGGNSSDFSVSASQRFSVSEALRSALADTVSHHLIADVPVGVFQSAGLDSSTLTAFVSEVHSKVQTVTLGFEEYRGTENDEVPLAETVARACKTDHRTIWVSRKDFEESTEAMFDAMDQPSTDGVNTYFVSMAARRAGLKVALSGLGGDELFGGYPSFHEIPRVVNALKPFGAVPALGRGFRIVSSAFLKHFTSPKYAGLLEYGTSFGGAYLLRRGMFMPWELPEILDPDLVREGWQRLNALAALNATASLDPQPSTLNGSPSFSVSASQRFSISDRLRVSALELSWYMRNQLLRDSDWAGMAHSLEIRVPLVDIHLLRSLLPALGSDTPPTKLDMAQSPISPLPSAVLARAKTGFTVPVRDWLLESNQKSAIRSQKSEDRGLRGWAREVYSRHGGTSYTAPHSRRIVAPISASQPFSLSASSPKRILVYRIGQLGDTIVALPAMWAVRKQFPDAHMTLLCDQHSGRSIVLAADLLRGAGIFDGFESYAVDDSLGGKLARPFRMLGLLLRLHGRKFDTLVYLAPSTRAREQVERDQKFFNLAGIKRFIGMRGFTNLPRKIPGQPLDATAAESDLLLTRLATDGIPVPEHGRGSLDLRIAAPENAEIETWLRELPDDNGRIWIGIAPGSKMPAKRWPEDRFQTVVSKLVESFDVWPVVFGGSEDAGLGNRLVRGWGCGYNAAGALSLRAAGAALRRCKMFLGNDTGTMHLAAAAGIPCVAVFSSREWPGMWFPYGVEQTILRSPIECEGCGLIVCVERRNECINRISPDEVFVACTPHLAPKKPQRAFVNPNR